MIIIFASNDVLYWISLPSSLLLFLFSMIQMVQPAFMYSISNFVSYFCQLVGLLLPSNQHSTLLNQLTLQLMMMIIIILSTLKMTTLSGQRNVTCGFTFTQQIVFPRSNLLPRTLFLLTLYHFPTQFALLMIPSLPSVVRTRIPCYRG